METTQEWKKKSYEELLAPLSLQFERSKNSYSRYLVNHHFLHAQTIKKANTAILQLLMEKSHLIPEQLTGDALKIIDHLDVWMEQFEQLVKELNPKSSTEFIFNRPLESIEFPKESELNFKKAMSNLKKEIGF